MVSGHGPIALEDIFTGDTPGIGAAAYVAGPLNLLLRNDLKPVQIEAVELTIDSFEEPRTRRSSASGSMRASPSPATPSPCAS